jgi:phosphohistidine phosphatase SixA
MSTAERLLYVVRHGATDWNQSGRIQGHMDIPLNKTGRAQARLASIRLAAICASALYSSDLLRAYETAQIIGQATGLQVVQEPRGSVKSISVCGRDCHRRRFASATQTSTPPAVPTLTTSLQPGLKRGGTFTIARCGLCTIFWLQPMHSASLW